MTSDSKRFDMIVGKSRARARLREFIKLNIGNKKDARVLCLPGENGREVEHVYRKLGISDRNIAGIEKDQRVAKLVRLHYPQIQVHEGKVGDFCAQYAASDGPPFSIVSLDYCGSFSLDKIRPLLYLAAGKKLTERAVIAVNLFVGREKGTPVSHLHAFHVLSERAKNRKFGLVTRQSLSQWDWQSKLKSVEEIKKGAPDASLMDARQDAVAMSVVNTMLFETRAAVAMHCLPHEDPRAFELNHTALLLLEDDLTLELGDWIREADEEKKLPEGHYDWAKAIVKLATDKHTRPYFLKKAEFYGYVNDAGHRMHFDLFLFDQQNNKFDRLPDVYSIVDKVVVWNPLLRDPETRRPFLAEYTIAGGDINWLHPEKYPSRIDLGGGAIPIDPERLKDKIISWIKKGRSNDDIMARVPVTAGTLRALRAHVTMKTYDGAEKVR